MPTPSTYQDVVFAQGSSTSTTLDVSQGGQSVPRRIVDYTGFSIQVSFSGSPVGTLELQLSNASVQNDQLVLPANYVTIDALTLSIGTGSDPATSPSLMQMTFARSGWVSLLWTPSGGSAGSLTCKFEGVRR